MAGKTDVIQKMPDRLRTRLYVRFEPLKAWAIICYCEREFQGRMYKENMPFDTFDEDITHVVQDMNKIAWDTYRNEY